MPEISLAATGDSFINRGLPAASPQAEALAALMSDADVRMTNLETVIRREEGYANAESGGTWAAAEPEVLAEMRRYGFNVLSCVNNHSMDYGEGGLLATLCYVRAQGYSPVGIGRNLAEASQPHYLECAGARVACLAATSTCPPAWAAGEQRPDMPGRPGVNALRFNTVHRVSEAQLAELKRIAADSQINARHELSVKEGFSVADAEGVARFGQHLFRAVRSGESAGASTWPVEADMQRMEQRIAEAADQADVVIVHIHAHEMAGSAKDQPAEFVRTFARRCIDAGAHAIVGHGPHILRGIELYRHRPIFYSLGNFIFQNETVRHLPADFYRKYGLGQEHTVAEALNARSGNGSGGIASNRRIWTSAVARWRMREGKLAALSLHPISLGPELPRSRRGWPALSSDEAPLHDLAKLSEPFGTRLEVSDGVARWTGAE